MDAKLAVGVATILVSVIIAEIIHTTARLSALERDLAVVTWRVEQLERRIRPPTPYGADP